MSVVAVLEDDPATLELIASVLAKRFTVLTFSSLKDAMALVEHPPDLLVTDVELPDGLGLDLVARLNHGGKRVPTIVLSELQTEADFERGFAVGASDYMAKPFRPQELLARCALHLKKSVTPEKQPKPGGLPLVDGLAFGRYAIESRLGAGGFGAVYKARDKARDGSRVALKVLSQTAQLQEETKLRFVRESYTLASIRDPHVVRVHDVGSFEGYLYLAMEYVEGETLEALVGRGTIGEVGARPLLRGLLRGLAALERAGVLHRDLKPANTVLRGGKLEDPVLIDFGLAKRPFDRSVTSPELVVGTPAYMAPETIHGQDADHRADLFSIGLTIRFALVGEEVFPAFQGIDLLNAMAHGPFHVPEVPLTPAFAALLESLIAVDPEKRPRSAIRALSMLDAIAEPPPPHVPRTAKTRPPKTATRLIDSIGNATEELPRKE